MNNKWVVAPKVLVKGPSGRYLFIQRSAPSKHFALQWELPGGKMDEGEEVGECLIRETLEETGLNLNISHVIGSGEGEIPGLRLAYMFMSGTVESEDVILSDEHDDYKWVTIEEALLLDLCPAFRTFVKTVVNEGFL